MAKQRVDMRLAEDLLKRVDAEAERRNAAAAPDAPRTTRTSLAEEGFELVLAAAAKPKRAPRTPEVERVAKTLVTERAKVRKAANPKAKPPGKGNGASGRPLTRAESFRLAAERQAQERAARTTKGRSK